MFGSCLSESLCDAGQEIATALATWIIVVIVIACIMVCLPLLVCFFCCVCGLTIGGMSLRNRPPQPGYVVHQSTVQHHVPPPPPAIGYVAVGAQPNMHTTQNSPPPAYSPPPP